MLWHIEIWGTTGRFQSFCIILSKHHDRDSAPSLAVIFSGPLFDLDHPSHRRLWKLGRIISQIPSTQSEMMWCWFWLQSSCVVWRYAPCDCAGSSTQPSGSPFNSVICLGSKEVYQSWKLKVKELPGWNGRIRESDRKNMSKDPTFVGPPVLALARWQDSTSLWSVWSLRSSNNSTDWREMFLVKTNGHSDNTWCPELFVCPSPRKFPLKISPGRCWSRLIQSSVGFPGQVHLGEQSSWKAATSTMFWVCMKSFCKESLYSWSPLSIRLGFASPSQEVSVIQATGSWGQSLLRHFLASSLSSSGKRQTIVFVNRSTWKYKKWWIGCYRLRNENSATICSPLRSPSQTYRLVATSLTTYML